MDYILTQYSSFIFGMLLILIVLAVFGMFIYVACQGDNQAPADEHTATQNKNINGGIRHPYKDINSY